MSAIEENGTTTSTPPEDELCYWHWRIVKIGDAIFSLKNILPNFISALQDELDESQKMFSLTEKANEIFRNSQPQQIKRERSKLANHYQEIFSDFQQVENQQIENRTQVLSTLSINELNNKHARVLSSEEIEEITQKEKAREIRELTNAKKGWQGREKMPEPIRDLLDVYVQLTGQHPTKGQLVDWLSTGQDWLELGIVSVDLRAAWAIAHPDDGRLVFLVNRPGSLTNTAGMCAGERRKRSTYFTPAEKKAESVFIDLDKDIMEQIRGNREHA